MKKIDLNRFVEAQSSAFAGYGDALAQMKAGRKSGHWIWYIFPTLYGWANSYNHNIYGLHGIEEAKAYLAHPVLGERLREITQVILSYSDDADPNVFMMWDVDAKKLLACMTLFDYISPDDIFGEVCRKFFKNKRSRKTLELILESNE